jgi:hypothetical protein
MWLGAVQITLDQLGFVAQQPVQNPEAWYRIRATWCRILLQCAESRWMEAD